LKATTLFKEMISKAVKSAQINRTFYRHFLRLSQNGERPEIFGNFGTSQILGDVARLGNSEISLSKPNKQSSTTKIMEYIPSNSRQVRIALRNAFVNEQSFNSNDDNSNDDNSSVTNDGEQITQMAETKRAEQRKMEKIDTFAAIRLAIRLSSVFYPEKLDTRVVAKSAANHKIPSDEEVVTNLTLPIFDYQNAALLTGEQTSFNFFEPRYRKLVTDAVSQGGYFLLRGYRVNLPLTVMVQIIDHVATEDGNHICVCAAGPRVDVLGEDKVEVRSTDDASTINDPLTVATGFQLLRDHDDVDNDCEDAGFDSSGQDQHLFRNNNELRSDCLELLLRTSSVENTFKAGLPPLDAEAFSFWSLRFLLAGTDFASRRRWLECRSTSQRLRYVKGVLEMFAERIDNTDDTDMAIKQE